MFCGDHVLPQISPNVSFLPQVEENPLGAYLQQPAGDRQAAGEDGLPGAPGAMVRALAHAQRSLCAIIMSGLRSWKGS